MRSYLRKLKKLYSRFQNKNIVFLHVGKTAGTSLRHYIWSTNIPFSYNVHFPKHGEVPILEPKNTLYFINIRDPFERIESGFNSRLRQGYPAYDNPWSDEERIFYKKYPSFIKFVEQCLTDKSVYLNFKKHNIHCQFGYDHYLSEIQNFGLKNQVQKLNYATCQEEVSLLLLETIRSPILHMHKSTCKQDFSQLALRNSFCDKFLTDEYHALKILKNE